MSIEMSSRLLVLDDMRQLASRMLHRVSSWSETEIAYGMSAH